MKHLPTIPDVILILGQGLEPDDSVPIHVQHEIQRALAFCKEQSIPAILFSGNYWGLRKNPHALPEANAMLAYAKTLPNKNIQLLTETQSLDTIGNLVFSKIIIDNHHWKNIMIMSNVQHIIRVQYIVKRIFNPQYTVTYQGHQAVTSAYQLRHTQHYRWFATIYTRWILRKTWPDDNTKMLHWLKQHHFLYNRSFLNKFMSI